MSDVNSITKRPQSVAFKPERIAMPNELDPSWVINDIRIGNRSQIDPRWYVRLWRRIAWRWRQLLVRLKLRKPDEVRLIGDRRG